MVNAIINTINGALPSYGAAADDRFIFTVKSDNAGTSASNQFTIPTTGAGYNYDVATDDGYSATGITGSHTITFPTGAGTHEVYISGDFPQVFFNNGGDRLKLLDISNFGIYALGSTNQSNAFYGCSNMTITATDSGNFGSVTNFINAWYACSSLTSFPLIDTSSGTNFGLAWHSCSSLTSFPLIDTSSVTNFTQAWFNCSSLTSFPLIDTSSGTTFNVAWQSCSSLTSFPLIDTSSGTNFTQTWNNCSSLTSFPLIDTSSGTNFQFTWRSCSSLTSFPLIDISSGTLFQSAWYACSSLTSFPLIDTSSGTNFTQTWNNCSSLANYPANAFDTNIATNYTNAFLTTNLTTQSIDDILVSLDTNGVTNGTFLQSGGQAPSVVGETAIDNLVAKGWTIVVTGGYDPTQFFTFTVKTDNAGVSGTDQFTIPTSTTGITQAFNYDIETSDGQTITGVTGNHTITFPSAGTHEVRISGIFPYMRFANGGDRLKMLDISNFGIYALGSTSQNQAFFGCSNMTITATDSGNFGSVTNFQATWASCSSLTSFPLLDTSSGTNFQSAWASCSSLTSFPLLDTSSVTNFQSAWNGCSSLTSFPLIDTSSVTNFQSTWFSCSSLTSFPLLDTSSGATFNSAWRSCSSLANYPANAFDTNIATNYANAFGSTNLTTQSIDDILVSLDASGVSNGTFLQSGGQAPSATGLIARDNLVAKGWTITVTA